MRVDKAIKHTAEMQTHIHQKLFIHALTANKYIFTYSRDATHIHQKLFIHALTANKYIFIYIYNPLTSPRIATVQGRKKSIKKIFCRKLAISSQRLKLYVSI
jgi:hypothetical protein